jgi:hypothetical protein
MPIIPDAWEVDNGRIMDQGHPWAKKKTKEKRGLGA